MNNEQLVKIIDNNYIVIFSLEGDRSLQSSNACSYFNRKKYYKIGSIIEIPNHKYKCSIVDVFISEKNKTVFIAVKEVCNCNELYDCCSCGGNDCGYCFDCNACEECLNDEN